MARKIIKQIVLKFEDGFDHTVDLLKDRGDGKMVYKYTAMFWHDTSVTTILANYYPRPGANMTVKMKESFDRDNRQSIESTIAGKYYSTISSIFPADVVHYWKMPGTRPDGDTAPPWALLKSSDSPITDLTGDHKIAGVSFVDPTTKLVNDEFSDLDSI